MRWRSSKLCLIALSTQLPTLRCNVPDHTSLETFAVALPFETERVSQFLLKLENYIGIIVHKQIGMGIHLRTLHQLQSQYFVIDCESDISQLRDKVFRSSLPRLEIACGGLTSSLTQPWTTSKEKIEDEMKSNWHALKTLSAEVARLSSTINTQARSELLNADLDNQYSFFQNEMAKMYHSSTGTLSQSTKEMILTCWRLLNEALLKRGVFQAQHLLVRNAVLERNWLQAVVGHLLPKDLRDSFSTEIESNELYGSDIVSKQNHVNYWHPRDAMDSDLSIEQEPSRETHLTCEFSTKSQIVKPFPGMSVISTENFLAMCIMEAFNKENLLLFPWIISYIKSRASFSTLQKVEQLRDTYASATHSEGSVVGSSEHSQVLGQIHNLVAVWLGETRAVAVQLQSTKERYNEIVNSLTATQMRISRAVNDLNKLYSRVIQDHSSTLRESHGTLHHTQFTGIFQRVAQLDGDERYAAIKTEKRQEILCARRIIKQLKSSMRETQLNAGDLFVSVINLEEHIVAFLRAFTRSKRVYSEGSEVASMIALVQQYMMHYEIPRLKAEIFDMHGKIALAQNHATKFSTCVMDTSLLTSSHADDRHLQCVEHEYTPSHDDAQSIPMLAAFLL
uniref:AlNc14C155G7617 protein n=1 Tax=Albugo laibachii Nc14 TaxID=890382 RepID=F0WMB2_9STRA|nr:AlNc14C155G7617 [Albugo laibachii Nc14]|eukprot:CCA22443.1 AlNc14C155G7617 [Albugo laibachii Nc14]